MTDLTPFNKKKSINISGGVDEFVNMIDDFLTDPLSAGRNLKNDTFKIDIEEKEDKFIIEADLPGVKKDEVEIKLKEGMLTIAIEREEKEEKEERNYIHKERRYSSMSRSIKLGEVKKDEISAKLEEGVLCIDIPKGGEKEEEKKITIQ